MIPPKKFNVDFMFKACTNNPFWIYQIMSMKVSKFPVSFKFSGKYWEKRKGTIE